MSVVIPAYNAEATINRCVKSVQANNIDLEIVIVNDGSQDRTGTLCDLLAQSDERIRVIHKENGGVGAARNTGLDSARGEYLAFVDADDTVADAIYSHMVSLAQRNKADCVVCCIENVFADHREQEKHIFGNQVVRGNHRIHEKIVVPLIVPGHPDAALLQSGCNKLYRTNMIRMHGLSFTSLPWAEDWMFNIEYFRKAECVAFTDQYLYQYDRTTPGSLSKTWNSDGFDNTVWIQNHLAELFPDRYTQEQLMRGVLGIQEEQLYSYANMVGTHGFFQYASTLFTNAELRRAYRELESVPPKYRFAEKCVRQEWEIAYSLWAAYLVRTAFLKHLLRPVYRTVQKMLRALQTADDKESTI